MRVQLVADDEIMFVAINKNKVTVINALTGTEEIKNEFENAKDAISNYQKIIYDLVQDWGFRPVLPDTKKVGNAITRHISNRKPPPAPPVFATQFA